MRVKFDVPQLERLFAQIDSLPSLTREELSRLSTLLNIPEPFVPVTFEREISDFRGLSPFPILEITYHRNEKSRVKFLNASREKIESRFLRSAVSDAERGIESLRSETFIAEESEDLLGQVSLAVLAIRSKISSTYSRLDGISDWLTRRYGLRDFSPSVADQLVREIKEIEYEAVERPLQEGDKRFFRVFAYEDGFKFKTLTTLAASYATLRNWNRMANDLYRRHAEVSPVVSIKKRVYQRVLQHLEGGGDLRHMDPATDYLLGTAAADKHLENAYTVIKRHPKLRTMDNFKNAVRMESDSLGLSRSAEAPGASIIEGIRRGLDRVNRPGWKRGFDNFRNRVIELYEIKVSRF